MDGITILRNIQYNIENISDNVDMMNVTHFTTGEREKIAIRGAQRLNSRYNQKFTDPSKRSRYKKQYRHHKNFPTLNGSRRFGLKFT